MKSPDFHPKKVFLIPNNQALIKVLRNKWTPVILIFLLTLFVFNIKFRYIGSGDTVPSELLPISIIKERDLDLNEFLAYKWLVGEGDKLPHWIKNVNGRMVSSVPIIPGLLNLPVYLLAHIFGVDLLAKRFFLSMITASIISALSVVFIYLILLNCCAKQSTAIFFTLIYAFATSVFSTACRGLWQHGPSLLFINISIFLLLNKNRSLVPYSGLFLGLAVFNRPTNIIIAIPLTIYLFFNQRDIFLKYILLAALPGFLLCLYSYIYWGNIFALGRAPGFGLFGGKFFPILAGLLFSPARGLFIFSPIFIFSFVYSLYLLFLKRTAPLLKYLSITVIASLLLYSRWSMWWGGHSFGYRLLIELIPMLCIFLALFWERTIVKIWYLKLVFYLFLAISIYFHFLGAYYYPSGFNTSPNDIDYNTERLWTIRDTELIRCTKNLLRDLHLYGYKEMIELKKRYAEEFYHQGNVHYEAGELDKAIEYYTKSLDFNPKLLSALNNRGIAYANQGELDKAIKDFSRAIALNPKLAPTMVMLAKVYELKGNREKARYWYEEALKNKDQLPTDQIEEIQRLLKELK